MDIKVEIYSTRMVLTSEAKTFIAEPDLPYSTTRLLVGNFLPAVQCLKKGLEGIGATGMFRRKPRITILPREFLEGGLSEIEERCLLEVALSAGAREVHIDPE